MGLAKSEDVASRFSAYVEGLTSVIGARGRAKPASRLLHRSDDVLRSQECRADDDDQGS